MELTAAVRARRMVRRFLPDPLPAGEVDRLLDLARRAPSAGNSQGTGFLVLEAPADRARFWAAVAPRDPAAGVGVGGAERRAAAAAAPVVVLPVADPDPYLARYREPDKAYARLGEPEAWRVPHWLTDAAMAVQTLLLAAADAGLGAHYLGVDHGIDALHEGFGIPARCTVLGAVLLGRPAPDDRPGASAGRPRRPLEDVVRRGRWTPGP